MKKTRIICILACFVILSACNIPVRPTETAVPPTLTPIPPTSTPLPPTPTVIPILPPTIQAIAIQPPAIAGGVVLVKVSGEVMDQCTQVVVAATEINPQTITITLRSTRDPGVICAQAITPFNLDIPIETSGLAAAVYEVVVNGSSGGTFEIKPTPAPNSASIAGLFWYDECRITGGEAGAPIVPGPNCLQISATSYTGNGILDSGEGVFSGVRIELGAGVCPSIGLAVAHTDAAGYYHFDNLSAGTYCVSYEILHPENVNILIPGGTTFPSTTDSEGNHYTITLAEGELRSDANFGWDFQP